MAGITAEQLLKPYDPAIRRLALELRGIVAKAAPKAEITVYPGWRTISFSLPGGTMKGGVCGISPAKAHVNLYFMHAAVDAPKGKLQGSGTKLRRLTFKPGDKLPITLIKDLVKQSVAHAGKALAGGGPARPRRAEKNRREDGYEISASRTVPVSLAALSKAVIPDAARTKWLPDPPMTVRKATPEKSLRITWHEPAGNVDLYLYPAGAGKAKIVIQHGRIATKAGAEAMRKMWGKALDRLVKLMG